jgi:hypothetical protein
MAVIFWVTVLVFLNFAAVLVRVLVDPEWYFDKKLAETGEFDFRGTGRVITIKVVQLIALGTLIAVLGGRLDYW